MYIILLFYNPFYNRIPFYSLLWMWELNCEESWVLKNWCFWTVVLEKTLESPLDCKEPLEILLFLFLCCCSVTQACPTLCDPMDCSTPGFPVLHSLSEFAQTHVHWVGDTIQPSHPVSSPSPPAFNLSHQQGLFQWVRSSHQVAKVLKLQLQHQSFQWILRVDFL